MTDTLNLFDCLLETARRQILSRQINLALATLRRLILFPDLSAAQSEQAHGLLGELLLRRRKYRRARHHLAIAARLNLTSARTLYLLGLACHHDPRGNHDRAARFYARSLQVAPKQVRCLGEAGLLAIERGEDEHGLDLLHRATEIEPDNAEAIVRFGRGLCLTGQPEEALRMVRLAMFCLPRSMALRQLSSDILLDRVRCRQESDAAERRDEEPEAVILPFLRVVGAVRAKRIRHDSVAGSHAPHLFRIRNRRKKRRAP